MWGGVYAEAAVRHDLRWSLSQMTQVDFWCNVRLIFISNQVFPDPDMWGFVIFTVCVKQFCIVIVRIYLPTPLRHIILRCILFVGDGHRCSPTLIMLWGRFLLCAAVWSGVRKLQCIRIKAVVKCKELWWDSFGDCWKPTIHSLWISERTERLSNVLQSVSRALSVSKCATRLFSRLLEVTQRICELPSVAPAMVWRAQ